MAAGCGQDNDLGTNDESAWGSDSSSGGEDAAEGADEADETGAEASGSAGDGDDASSDSAGDGDSTSQGGDGDSSSAGDGDSGSTDSTSTSETGSSSDGGDGDGDTSTTGTGDGDGDGEVEMFPPGDPPGNSTFGVWYEVLNVEGCMAGGDVVLVAPWGAGTSVSNNSGADFEVGITELKLVVNAFGYPTLEIDVPFVEPVPQFETVTNGGYGGVMLTFDPASPVIDSAICDYCNAGGEHHLEAEFVVDGMTVGWFGDQVSSINCLG